jgi:hypothetical protein
MQMCPKIVETWHGLIILAHKLDIKRSQHLTPCHYNSKIRQQLVKIQNFDNIIFHKYKPQIIPRVHTTENSTSLKHKKVQIEV